jgi:hypothetical protein
MRNAPHRKIDLAMLDYFERLCVDIEATKQELHERTSARRAELHLHIHAAEAEATKADEVCERIDRRVEVAGYIAGAPGLDGLRAQQGQL